MNFNHKLEISKQIAVVGGQTVAAVEQTAAGEQTAVEGQIVVAVEEQTAAEGPASAAAEPEQKAG